MAIITFTLLKPNKFELKMIYVNTYKKNQKN
jgi:hypothetical protein